MWTRLVRATLAITFALGGMGADALASTSDVDGMRAQGMAVSLDAADSVMDEASRSASSGLPCGPEGEGGQPEAQAGTWLVADGAGGVFADGRGVVRIPVSEAFDEEGTSLLLPECSYEGRRLCGWWSADGCVQVADGSNEVLDRDLLEEALSSRTDEIEIAAVWEPLTYHQLVRARFQDADGCYGEEEDVLERDCELGEEVVWELEPDGVFEGASVSYEVCGDTCTVVDVRRSTWTLILEDPGVEDESCEVYVGAEVDLGEHLGQRAGERLVGWDGGGTVLEPDARVCDLAQAGETMVLRAVWEPEPDTHDAGDGTGEDAGQAFGLPVYAPASCLYTFRGWSRDLTEASGDPCVQERVARMHDGQQSPGHFDVDVPVSLEVVADEEGVLSGQVRICGPSVPAGIVVLESVVAEAQGSWCLAGSVDEVGQDEFFLSMRLGDGRRVDVEANGATIGVWEPLASTAETVIEISGRIGQRYMAETNFCRLRWNFRVEPSSDTCAG